MSSNDAESEPSKDDEFDRFINVVLGPEGADGLPNTRVLARKQVVDLPADSPRIVTPKNASCAVLKQALASQGIRSIEVNDCTIGIEGLVKLYVTISPSRDRIAFCATLVTRGVAAAHRYAEWANEINSTFAILKSYCSTHSGMPCFRFMYDLFLLNGLEPRDLVTCLRVFETLTGKAMRKAARAGF